MIMQNSLAAVEKEGVIINNNNQTAIRDFKGDTKKPVLETEWIGQPLPVGIVASDPYGFMGQIGSILANVQSKTKTRLICDTPDLTLKHLGYELTLERKESGSGEAYIAQRFKQMVGPDENGIRQRYEYKANSESFSAEKQEGPILPDFSAVKDKKIRSLLKEHIHPDDLRVLGIIQYTAYSLHEPIESDRDIGVSFPLELVFDAGWVAPIYDLDKRTDFAVFEIDNEEGCYKSVLQASQILHGISEDHPIQWVSKSDKILRVTGFESPVDSKIQRALRLWEGNIIEKSPSLPSPDLSFLYGAF